MSVCDLHEWEESAQSETERSIDFERRNDVNFFKYQFKEAIELLRDTGSFAVYTSTPNFTIPGMHIAHIGHIAIPVSTTDATRLIQHSKQAPFGMKELTVTDTSVRKTWEIEASQITFSNPAWDEWLQNVVAEVSSQLGVDTTLKTVRAELYKLLVYEEGSMFVEHRDTEKVPDMFGTLVICLPSEHKGGKVRLHHNGKELLFESDDKSAWQMSYMAWYADVPHEIQPVKSGNRIVLTYNLACTHEIEQPSVAASQVIQARIDEEFVKWDEDETLPPFLCYALAHKYTLQSLRVCALKGSDHNRAQLVLERSQKSNISFLFLAQLERVVEDCEDPSTYMRLEHIVLPDGTKLLEHHEVEMCNLMQRSMYRDRNYDEQSGGGYFGNGYDSVEMRYKDTVLVLVHKDTVGRFLLPEGYSQTDYDGLFQQFASNWHNIKNVFIQELINSLRESVMAELQIHAEPSCALLEVIFLAACSAKDYDLAEDIVSIGSGGFSLQTYLGLATLLATSSSDLPQHLYLRAFHGTLHENDYEITESGIGSENWVCDRAAESLNEATQVDELDGPALLHVPQASDDTFFTESIEPFVNRFKSDKKFVNALIVAIFEQPPQDTSSRSNALRLLSLVIDKVLQHFDLSDYLSLIIASRQRRGKTLGPEKDGGKVLATNVLQDLHKVLLRQSETDAADLLETIREQCLDMEYKDLRRFIFPFLEHMTHLIDADPTGGCNYYQSMLTILVERYLGKEPAPPTDWVRPDEAAAVECDLKEGEKCVTCTKLIEFLLDPKRRYQSFDRKKYNRWHLERVCPDYCGTYSRSASFEIWKTDRAHKSRREGWLRRRKFVENGFARLPLERLKQHLGQEFTELLQLSHVRLKPRDRSEA